MRLTAKEINDLVSRGAIIGPSVKLPEDGQPEPEAKAAELIEPGIAVLLDQAGVVIAVAVRTVSEINARDWKGRQRRTKEARKAVREAVGPHLDLLEPAAQAYHEGKALRVTFTRLGGRKMDRSNLPTALKATEDATAYLLGADDGDPRWHSFFEQEPGGPAGVRVRIEEYR